MNEKLTDWIDRRLRETANLGEASALVANDLAANIPHECLREPDTLDLVVEVSGGVLQAIYAEEPDLLSVILIDNDDAEVNPGEGARRIQADSLAELHNDAKAAIFDAGICPGKTR